MTSALRNISWLILFFFAAFLSILTAEYLSFKPDIRFLQVKQEVIHNVLWRSSFYVHITTSMVVLFIGPLQFIKKLRNKNLNLHRILGKIYVYGILLFAAPSGLIMAFYAEGGTPSSIAFIIMSLLWFSTTFLAVKTIINKNIIAHQKWMMRSYALTFAAVTLRVLVPVFSELGFGDNFVVVSTAWLSWILNLIFVELLIRFKFGKNQTGKTAHPV